jgi:hypothetical protein
MKLEQLRVNVLSLTMSELITKVMNDSSIRDARLIQSMSKIDTAESKVRTERLSSEEKAILKALGLTAKDIKALKGAQDERQV